MKDIEEKVKKMENTVIHGVMREKDEIIRKANEKYENELNEYEAELLSDFESQINNYKRELDFEYKKAVSKAMLDAKHTLVAERNRLSDKVFENVKCKLLEFRNNDEEYEKFLIRKISDGIKELNADDLWLFLCEKDMHFSDLVKNNFSDLGIICDNSIKLGGFKIACESKKVILDMTFEKMLEDQKDDFAAYCSLVI